MVSKNIDTWAIKTDLEKMENANNRQMEEDAKLYSKLLSIHSFWQGSSADAFVAWAEKHKKETLEIREETAKDIDETQDYVDRVIELDLKYMEQVYGFGSDLSIGTSAGDVAAGVPAGMFSMEFREWLSKVSSVPADASALAEHYKNLGKSMNEMYFIYAQFVRSGVTPEQLGKIEELGMTFDDVVTNYSKITVPGDRQIYTYMLQGGEYFDNMDRTQWKGLLTRIEGNGQLNDKTKILLLDEVKGIGGYYRSHYNVNAYTNDGKNAVTLISKAERELVILCFESLNPKQAGSLDKFFERSGYDKNSTNTKETALYQKYEEDIKNIKFISYTAPEPYRSLFLNNVSKEKILLNTDKIDQMNVIALDGIIVDLDGALEDEQGPYSTFFHELGHGLDDLMYPVGNYSSHYTDDITKYIGMGAYYAGKTEVTLKQAIEFDCSQKVLDTINEKAGSLSMQDKQIVLNLILSNREDREEYRKYCNLYLNKTAEERETIEQAVEVVKEKIAGNKTTDGELTGEVNATASDVYGGVSHNQLLGDRNWGHSENIYWYLYNGGMTSREATADYFSVQMTGDVKAMESMEKYLGNSTKLLEGMYESMAQKEGISYDKNN